MQTHHRFVAAGAAAIMIGSLCPWATAFGLLTVSGLQCGLGWGALLAGLLIVGLEARPEWLARRASWAVQHRTALETALGAIVALLCIFMLAGFSSYGAAISADWGLYLTAAASGAVIWGSLRRNG